MKTKIRNSISGLLLIPLVLAGFALLPSVQATPDPGAVGGFANTADGSAAMDSVAATGEFNTAFGTNALTSLTTGDNNSAQGNSALFSLTTGSGNSAIGSIALRFLTTGIHNVAIGNTALNNVTTGSRNTAVGYGTLRSGNSSDNTAVGWSAGISNTTGTNNVAVGKEALASNTAGNNNTAIGTAALVSKTGGNNNVALGVEALASNTAGGSNTAIGFRALRSNPGSNNIALGFNAGINLSAGNNNIDIGNPGAVFGESSTIRIGSASQSRTFIAGIRGVVPPVGVLLPVYIDLNGQLGNTVSSRRFKKEIKAMDNASEAIHALKPVTFHYKSDTTSTPQFGLIAEEVAAVNPDLVVRDENGAIYTVRYEAVNAMLLNEFLKEHRKVEQLTKDFETKLAQQQKQIEALTAGLQKVSAQVEMNRTAPQTVLNNQ
jgi:trimeric autotransporter adhesin